MSAAAGNTGWAGTGMGWTVGVPAANRGCEMSENERHPEYRTFKNNVDLTLKELRTPGGRFGKSAVLCADAAVTIEQLREICLDAYAVIDVLAIGVGKIATPDGFFDLWNRTGGKLERIGAKPFKDRIAAKAEAQP